MMLEGAKLLAASMSAVEWCKSCAHISFLSEVIQINMGQLLQCEQGIGIATLSSLLLPRPVSTPLSIVSDVARPV